MTLNWNKHSIIILFQQGVIMFAKLNLKSMALMLASLAVVCACSKKDVKNDQAGDQAATGDQAGSVTDRPINFDPQGSDSGKIAGLNTIYFAYDKSALTADAKKKLAENADWIKKNPKSNIQIEGHTDERGSVEYNLALGDRRAKSVRKYLIDSGVEAKRLKVISYGKEKPVASGDSEEAYSKNRRANFVPLAE